MKQNQSGKQAVIVWRTLPFALMTATEYNRISQLRQAVFVVEQACCYQDADDFDVTSSHLVAEAEDSIVACCRLLPPGTRFAEPSIGRVCTDLQWRNQGLGREMMERALAQLQHDHPQHPVRISAQHYLQDFYSRIGFEQASDLYDEDGIAHIEMLFTKTTDKPIKRPAT